MPRVVFSEMCVRQSYDGAISDSSRLVVVIEGFHGFADPVGTNELDWRMCCEEREGCLKHQAFLPYTTLMGPARGFASISLNPASLSRLMTWLCVCEFPSVESTIMLSANSAG